jgi:hypothetical protein
MFQYHYNLQVLYYSLVPTGLVQQGVELIASQSERLEQPLVAQTASQSQRTQNKNFVFVQTATQSKRNTLFFKILIHQFLK